MSASRMTIGTTALVGLLILAGAAQAQGQAQVFAPAQGKVENVEWTRSGTTITVTYDLTSSDPTAVFKVALMAAMEGMSFTPVAVTGDIGDTVVPGKGKKIIWQVSKDTDSQDYDLFKFSVLAVSGRLKEVPNPEPAATKPPVTPAAPLPADLRGTWLGSYAGSATAELVVDRQTGAMFAGRLKLAMKAGDEPTELSVEGTVTMQAIEVREVAVVKPGKQPTWNLGSGLGSLDADGRAMRGTGKDRRTTYTWTFSKQGPAGAAPAAQAPPVQTPAAQPAAPGASNLLGVWSGTYASFQAQLDLSIREDAKYSGRLTVTTKAGKAPTVLDVEIMLMGQNITIREARVVMAGAVATWNLGSGTGTLDPSGQRMGGSGRDNRSTFTWALAKVPGK